MRNNERLSSRVSKTFRTAEEALGETTSVEHAATDNIVCSERKVSHKISLRRKENACIASPDHGRKSEVSKEEDWLS